MDQTYDVHPNVCMPNIPLSVYTSVSLFRCALFFYGYDIGHCEFRMKYFRTSRFYYRSVCLITVSLSFQTDAIQI